jgi:hypothetical protein
MAARMTSDANDAVQAQDAPRLGIGRVLLADMHAVASRRQREVGTVVHEESDAALLGDGPERVGGTAYRVVVGLLEAKLH